MGRTKENILVSAASISADLGEVSRIAKHISIGVKNAKAIASRAGDRARGFQPITDFINEMAVEIMSLVKVIDATALKITKLASGYTHSVDASNRLNIVSRAADELKYGAAIKRVSETVQDDLAVKRKDLRREARKLALLLDDIERRVKAAQVISNTSRVEASRAMEYRQSLEGVAESLEEETNQIKERVVRCQTRLDDVLSNIS